MLRRNGMLVRMIYKNIDRRNMLLYSCSIILSVVLETVFGAAHMAADRYGLRDKAGSMEWLCTVFFLIAGFVSVFFMLYATGYYVRTKNRDYSLLFMLGSGRKLIFRFFAIEFLLIYLFSVASGILTGGLFSILFLTLLEGLRYHVTLSIADVIYIAGSVVKVNCMLFLIEFPLILLYFSKRSLSEMQLREVKRERRNDRTGFLVIGGIILIACAMYLRNENDLLYHYISMVLCLTGVYLFMTFGGSLLLMLVKRFRNFYYRHMIALSEFYYRFKSNCRLLFIMLTLDFVVLFFTGGTVISQMPEDVDSPEYPYGFVGVMEDGGLQDMAREIMGGSSVEISALKGYLDCFDQEDMEAAKKECFCISDRDYSRLTAHDIRLKDTEAVWINESTIADLEKPESVYLSESSVFTIAEGWNEIVFGTEKPDCLREFVILPESVIAACQEEPYRILVRKGSAQEEFEQYGRYFREETNLFWRCAFLKDADENMDFVKIISVFAGIFCLFSCFGIFALKMQSDMSSLHKRYELLYDIGMSEGAIRKAISGEYRRLLGIPVVLSVLLSGIYMLSEMSGRDMIIRYFICRYLPLQMLFVCLNLVYFVWIRKTIFKSACPLMPAVCSGGVDLRAASRQSARKWRL